MKCHILDTEQSVFAISTYQSTILQANSHDDKPVTCFMLSKPMKDGVEEKNSFWATSTSSSSRLTGSIAEPSTTVGRAIPHENFPRRQYSQSRWYAKGSTELKQGLEHAIGLVLCFC